MDLAELRELYEDGPRPKYVFFWRHEAERPGEIAPFCLSNWYPAAFEIDGVPYPTTEHFMMAEKARLFDDREVLEQILAADHPGAVQKLGRQVRGFRNEPWNERRREIVVRGVAAKFSQNAELGDYLAGTKKRVLVEASPHDRIWGIGLSKDDPRAQSPLEWRGLNLLGFALMEARDRIS